MCHREKGVRSMRAINSDALAAAFDEAGIT